MKLFLLAVVLPLHFFLASPLAFYFGNYEVVGFDFLDFFPFLFLFFLLASLVVYLLLFSIRKSNLISSIVAGLLAGLSFSVWIQTQFLVWNFGPLDGRGIAWDKWSMHSYLEVSIWGGVIAVLIWISLRRYNLFQSALLSIVFVGILSSLVSFLVIPSGLLLDMSEKDVDAPFKFHPENNTIVILMDTFQSDVFEKIASTYPEEVLLVS